MLVPRFCLRWISWIALGDVFQDRKQLESERESGGGGGGSCRLSMFRRNGERHKSFWQSGLNGGETRKRRERNVGGGRKMGMIEQSGRNRSSSVSNIGADIRRGDFSKSFRRTRTAAPCFEAKVRTEARGNDAEETIGPQSVAGRAEPKEGWDSSRRNEVGRNRVAAIRRNVNLGRRFD